MKVEHIWGFIPNLRSFIILCFHANEQKNAKDAKAMLSKASHPLLPTMLLGCLIYQAAAAFLARGKKSQHRGKC